MPEPELAEERGSDAAPRKRRGSKEVIVEHMNPCVGLLVVAGLVSVSVLFALTFASVVEARADLL